ncbi:ubiquinol-cytochrome C chaperone family protein [Thalassospira lucentensis]|uniref:ubiquinol-cytochrome C chaperone family protein n=1 Tax=Thalassospira lucentensis TaxID=168935 RepID=UPI00142E63C2|nr:ubiquinol-cytochrome C chaperone family protein [Thalassospira lucentensis]NIZ02226.1 phage tail protein [Thalassospira lucentensis]
MFGWLKKKDRKHASAVDLYTAMVTQARQPEFYSKLGVADTKEGRFDLILVHAFILFRRLKAEDGDKDLAQEVFDVMFADLDQNMREMGIGDVGILKRIRKMSDSYHGRIVAYEEGMQSGAAELAAALDRNLYADTDVRDEQLMAVVGYVHDALTLLEQQTLSEIQNGKVRFPDVPVPAVTTP